MYIHNLEGLLVQVLQLPIRDGNQQLILEIDSFVKKLLKYTSLAKSLEFVSA